MCSKQQKHRPNRAGVRELHSLRVGLVLARFEQDGVAVLDGVGLGSGHRATVEDEDVALAVQHRRVDLQAAVFQRVQGNAAGARASRLIGQNRPLSPTQMDTRINPRFSRGFGLMGFGTAFVASLSTASA